MKLTYREISATKLSLAKLMAEKFPLAVGHKLIKLAKVLMPEIETYEKLRGDLFKQYGTQTPENPMEYAEPLPTDPKFVPFNQQMKELLDMEVELEIEVVLIPETVVITCPKCGIIAHKPLEVEPLTMLLLESFVQREAKEDA